MTNPGLIEDPRAEEQKLKDYQHAEISSAVALNWNRGIEGAPLYSDRDQDGSGSCVAQASGTGLETYLNQVISAHPIYARRPNSPGFGMFLQAAGNIVRHLGTTSEDKDPSQKMTEQQMDAPVSVPTPINNYLYAFVDVTDIDALATAIETHKHCLITINANLDEYAYSDKPVVNPGAPLNCAHCICGIYYFKDEKREKCILIKESWGPKNIRLRTLTESFLKARANGAMYYIAPQPITPQKPKFAFTVPLTFGMMNSLGVKNLQDILKFEGLFPVNVPSTGNYLEISRKSVLAWQLKHQVDTPEILNSLQGRRVGDKTILKLNSIYS